MNEPNLPSELISPTEAMKRAYCYLTAQSYDRLKDMRVLAVYRTASNDYHVVVDLYKQYCILFMNQYRTGHTTVKMTVQGNDHSAKASGARIASMIGATLIEEVDTHE